MKVILKKFYKYILTSYIYNWQFEYSEKIIIFYVLIIIRLVAVRLLFLAMFMAISHVAY